MIKIYLDPDAVQHDEYKVYHDTEGLFEHYTLQKLDFAKYDHIFQEIEKPEWINYEFWCLKNMFGKCSFNRLSTGMKNLMNYLCFAENYESDESLHGTILDMSYMGSNAFYYLFKYANYYNVPFFFDNSTMGFWNLQQRQRKKQTLF
jgi:hypothetical protein